MNIVIDGRAIKKNMAGIGQYSHNLIKSLLKEKEKENISLFLFKESIFKYCFSKVEILPISFFFDNHPFEEIWESFYLPFKLKKLKCDIFHVLHYNIPLITPLITPCKIIVNIPDLIPFLLPQTYPYKFRMYVQYRIRQAVKKASKIITISHTTKQDLINILKVPQEKISVIYGGCNFLHLKNKNTSFKYLEKYGIKNRYILFVGTLEPRKNIKILIYAFNTLIKEYKEKINLVIVGQKGWLCKEIIKKIKINRNIVYPGYIPLEDLLTLYQNASLFVYPSLYEGFGFPVLEAMACRIPVIVSSKGALPEIVKDAAWKINPYNYKEIKDAMYELLINNTLREEYIKKGLERIKSFSWEKAAKNTLKIYKEVING